MVRSACWWWRVITGWAWPTDLLDDGDVDPEVRERGRGGAPGGVEGDRWDAGVFEGGVRYRPEGGQAT
jgi:hypothetical protein